MKKGVFRELVNLRVNGGNLTDESSVETVDIDAYLPSAVNYIMTTGRNKHLAQDGDRDIPSMFYGSFNNITINKSTDSHYIEYPKGAIALYGNEGIRYVKDNCGNTYSPLSDSDMHTVNYYKDKMQLGFYRPKKDYIQVWETNPLVETMDLEMIVRVEDLEDDDELPIEAGMESQALELCVQWFTGERQMPSDKLNNKSDINTQPNI